MDLNKLPKIVNRSAKRVGRGIGSGKGGHTSGRGSKGQKAREKIPLRFEGTKTKKSMVKRLPFLRGRSKFKPLNPAPAVINLKDLADWPEKTPVTIPNLIKRGWLAGSTAAIMILGDGKIEKSLTVSVPVSAGAAEKIQKAGGKVERKI